MIPWQLANFHPGTPSEEGLIEVRVRVVFYAFDKVGDNNRDGLPSGEHTKSN